MPSTPSWVLSFVMQICSGTSSGTSLSEWTYATLSKNGMMRFRPGSRVPWKRPSRSTTQALCCGTIRTPSMTKATMTPISSTQPQYGLKAGTCEAMMATTTAAASFQNIVFSPGTCDAPPLSGGAVLGDFERVAIGGKHKHGGARLQGFAALDAGLPARTAIAHAREARACIEPAFKACRHAAVDRRHAHSERARAIDMHAIAADRREQRGNDALGRKWLLEVGNGRGTKCGDREHQQIESAAQQLGNDQHQCGDGPGKRGVHEASIWHAAGRCATSRYNRRDAGPRADLAR